MTPLETRILNLLTNQWQTRKQLTVSLNRKAGSLSPSDLIILDRLETKGMIESRTQLVGVVKKRYEYRKR